LLRATILDRVWGKRYEKSGAYYPFFEYVMCCGISTLFPSLFPCGIIDAFRFTILEVDAPFN
jgi:hypothetical protein